MEYNKTRVVGWVWFTSAHEHSTGIVVTQNSIQEMKARIAPALKHGEEKDIEYIALFGGKFPLEQAIEVIRKVGMTNPLFHDQGLIKELFYSGKPETKEES